MYEKEMDKLLDGEYESRVKLMANTIANDDDFKIKFIADSITLICPFVEISEDIDELSLLESIFFASSSVIRNENKSEEMKSYIKFKNIIKNTERIVRGLTPYDDNSKKIKQKLLQFINYVNKNPFKDFTYTKPTVFDALSTLDETILLYKKILADLKSNAEQKRDKTNEINPTTSFIHRLIIKLEEDTFDPIGNKVAAEIFDKKMKQVSTNYTEARSTGCLNSHTDAIEAFESLFKRLDFK